MHRGDTRRIIEHAFAGNLSGGGTAADVGFGEGLFDVLEDSIFHVRGGTEDQNQLGLIGMCQSLWRRHPAAIGGPQGSRNLHSLTLQRSCWGALRAF